MKKSKNTNFDSEEVTPSSNGEDINRNEQFQLYRNGKIYLPRKSKIRINIKKKYKIIIGFPLIAISLYLFVKLFLFIGMGFSGPYANCEIYKFNISHSELVSEIEKFRILHPRLVPPSDDPIFGNASYDSTDLWSAIYFYYPDNKNILMTFVYHEDNNKSSLAFNAIWNPNVEDSQNHGDINSSIGYFENIKQKRIFVDRIVNPLHKQIQEKYRRSKKH